MIKRLKYEEIDFEAYSSCINRSIQKNLYAQRAVLDLLCESWELLIYGDYDYVMPVPLTRKVGLKCVSMPVFIQQLGVFGPESNSAINLIFLNKLQQNYIVMNYAFNVGNSIPKPITKRKNYIIQRQDYAELYRKSFSKGRKSVLKKAENLTLKTQKLNTESEVFILKHFKGVDKKQDIEQFLRFVSDFPKLHLRHVYAREQLISVAVMTEDEESFGLLALINDDEFRNLNAASYLINEFLKQQIAIKSLDFMGGNIRGIEVFFKSFGAQMVTYPVLQNSKKSLIHNILRKILQR